MKHWIIILLIGMSACGGEFIPDPLDPRLPRYSEEGKNVAGCFINGDVWRAVKTGANLQGGVDQILQIDFQAESNTIRFRIDGYREDSTNLAGTSVTLTFVVDNRDWQIQSVDDLHGRTFELDGNTSYGNIEDASNFFQYDNCRSTGQLFIRYAQPFLSASDDFIVAGTFYLTNDSPSCIRTEVRSGRFDYRVISPATNQ